MSLHLTTRLRRMRKTENIRSMIRETQLDINDLVYPLFVCEGTNVKKEISSMPGTYQMSIDVIVAECKEVESIGLQAVILFGIPEYKDETGAVSLKDDGIIQRAIRAIKSEVKNLLVIADVCLCEYTTHGHCGIIVNQYVDNDSTVAVLQKQAVSYAQAGVDMVAPSDMMDGRVGAIREALDEHGFINVPIMAYSAKFASAFYGPFREAAESAPKFGDRKSYQMDAANTNEAMREIELDIAEGADIVMVKPALSYLDIIYRAKTEFNIPIAAYNVSGEYACIIAAAQKGWVDREKIMMEVLLSIKRAGADIIITYFAKEVAKILRKN